jgi:hypothetical protein
MGHFITALLHAALVTHAAVVAGAQLVEGDVESLVFVSLTAAMLSATV